MLVTSTKATPSARAISPAHGLNRPEPRSTFPAAQMLRTVSDRTMGVAPLARVSAMNFRIYHPKVCTTSCLPVTWLSISWLSSPRPGSEPRARCVSLIGPPSLWPNWISTKSPVFTSASTLSHRPSV